MCVLICSRHSGTDSRSPNEKPSFHYGTLPEYIHASSAAFEAIRFLEKADSYKKDIISILFRDMNMEQENIRTILKHVVKFSNVVEWKGCIREELSPSGQVSIDRDVPEVDRQDSEVQLQDSRTMTKKLDRTFKSKVFKELLLGMPPKPRSGSSPPSNGNHEDLTMGNVGNGISNHCVWYSDGNSWLPIDSTIITSKLFIRLFYGIFIPEV